MTVLGKELHNNGAARRLKNRCVHAHGIRVVARLCMMVARSQSEANVFREMRAKRDALHNISFGPNASQERGKHHKQIINNITDN